MTDLSRNGNMSSPLTITKRTFSGRVLYPTEEWGVAWDLRKWGQSGRGGMREGPAPQDGEQDKQLTASREGVNSSMEQEEVVKKSQA